MANYSLPEIADFLTTEQVALHGISEEVYMQNTAIMRALGHVATTAGEGVLTVQLFGSRASGYSDLESDIDINIIATNESADNAMMQQVQAKMAEVAPGRWADYAARILTDISNPVPIDSDAFTEWVLRDRGLHGIFGDGVIPSDGLMLTRLAVLEVMKRRMTQYERDKVYERMRTEHTKVFLGNLARTQIKLAERLEMPLPEVSAVVSGRTYLERQDRFGIHPRFLSHYMKLSEWVTENNDRLKNLPTYDLFHTVAA